MILLYRELNLNNIELLCNIERRLASVNQYFGIIISLITISGDF